MCKLLGCDKEPRKGKQYCGEDNVRETCAFKQREIMAKLRAGRKRVEKKDSVAISEYVQGAHASGYFQ